MHQTIKLQVLVTIARLRPQLYRTDSCSIALIPARNPSWSSYLNSTWSWCLALNFTRVNWPSVFNNWSGNRSELWVMDRTMTHGQAVLEVEVELQVEVKLEFFSTWRTQLRSRRTGAWPPVRRSWGYAPFPSILFCSLIFFPARACQCQRCCDYLIIYFLFFSDVGTRCMLDPQTPQLLPRGHQGKCRLILITAPLVTNYSELKIFHYWKFYNANVGNTNTLIK